MKQGGCSCDSWKQHFFLEVEVTPSFIFFWGLYMDGHPLVLSCCVLYRSVDWFECRRREDKQKTCPSRFCLLGLVSIILSKKARLNYSTVEGGQSATATVNQGHTFESDFDIFFFASHWYCDVKFVSKCIDYVVMNIITLPYLWQDDALIRLMTFV